MARQYGAYMIQPTKDELRTNITRLRRERDNADNEIERLKLELEEIQEKLDEAYHLIGKHQVKVSLARKKAI